MTSVWKTKVLPGLNKIFDKDGKKAAASEFLKSFNKEEISKEIEDKKAELEPKVVEVYEASPAEIKALINDKKPAKMKKNSAAVTKFLEELAKIDFPGAKPVSDAVAKSGTTHLAGPIAFMLDKVAPFVPKEEPKAAEPAAAEAAAETASREVAVEEKKEEGEATTAAAAPSSEVVEKKKEEEKKEEEKKEEAKEEEKPAAPAAAEAAASEPEKK